MTPLSATWMAAFCCMPVASIAWRRAHPESFSQWREAPAALLSLFSFGLGPGWLQTRRRLDDFDPPQCTYSGATLAGIATHVSLLLFASGAMGMAAMALSLRVRLRWARRLKPRWQPGALFAEQQCHQILAWMRCWRGCSSAVAQWPTTLWPTSSRCPLAARSLSVAIWLAVACNALQYTPHICGAAPLAHPTAQRLTHHTYEWLSILAYLLPQPLSVVVQHGALGECATVIRFFQFGLGLLAPQLAAGLSEARLFQRHQQQRRQAGLPPERGVHAAVYDFLWWLMLGGSGVHTSLVSLALLAACWDWCAFFTSGA